MHAGNNFLLEQSSRRHLSSEAIVQTPSIICWIYCYIVRRILENLTGIVIFSNFASLLLSIHVQIIFHMLGNFGRIFFQAVLVGFSLRKESWTNKNAFCNYYKFQDVLGVGRFSSWDEVFTWKILPRLCRDLTLNKWDPT